MFLQKKGMSWSGSLLRDELFHAGIRHSRTRLPAASWPVRDDTPDLTHAVSTVVAYPPRDEGHRPTP